MPKQSMQGCSGNHASYCWVLGGPRVINRMLPALALKWTTLDEVLDGQWVGVHEIWEPFPEFMELLLIFKTTYPQPPRDTQFGNWLVTPITIGEKMPPYPARFLIGEATRCTFDERPFWRVADKLIPVAAGPVQFLVVTIDDVR